MKTLRCLSCRERLSKNCRELCRRCAWLINSATAKTAIELPLSTTTVAVALPIAPSAGPQLIHSAMTARN